MTRFSVSVEIDAPVERTWAVVTDWERQGEWMPLTEVRVSADSAMGVGAKISARSGSGNACVVDPMVVDVWQPPHRCEVVHLGKVVAGRGTFVVEALPGDRSRFTWQEELEASEARRLVDQVGLPPTRDLLDAALGRLTSLVAGEPS
jgi:uncharacterized protein YndB with AHSA1/START domain